ncbi:MAG TPA: sugar ABC transporter ATP-binding protein [Albitalea sp.]|nr:sugar ABC transporter ATP-binding protein [Albitalea sp.]HUG21536.1 sugar ABC transporter ATP-binding protein [Albitalea sp.]
MNEAAGEGGGPLLEAAGIRRSFGAVQALRGVDLRLARGESVGIVGHNGAGKSTLMNILGGSLAPDGGRLMLSGRDIPRGFGVREAQRLGIRCVFQELSLCANLTLAENMHVAQPGGGAIGWRQRAGALLMASLDGIFPGHGLHPGDVVGDLPIGKRQAVEIARAFTAGRDPVEIVILDEPTSSLDLRAAQQLLAHIRAFVAQRKTCVLITHKLREIFDAADRVVVMRDGQVVDDVATARTDRSRVVAAMGQSEQPPRDAAAQRAVASTGSVVVRANAGAGDRCALTARRGEVIGLAGLAGHGQTRLLMRVRDAASRYRSDADLQVHAAAAFVAGDRQADGIFSLWSIARNMTLPSLARFRRRLLIDPAAERAAVDTWRERMGLVTPDVGLSIVSLSGGNQQKVLFARALSSPAELILMDDPMRGVDVGTKRDVYGLIAEQARGGRTFLWYTTEFDELFHCDRVYVFNNGRIVGEIERDALSEERVLSLSFEDAA